MKQYFFFVSLVLCSLVSEAQLGGNSTYSFLNMPIAARPSALGGTNVSVRDSDLNMVDQNPSLLDSNMDRHASLNYINYVADINYGYMAYARKLKKHGMFSAGMQFLDYGKFTRADQTGLRSGEFRAGDYALLLTHARPIDSLFSVGGTFKTIYSNLDSYNSFGMAVDLSGSYLSKNKRFSAGLVIRNLGIQLKSYVAGNRENLPLQINLGISQRLSKAPIRVSLQAVNLQRWDLTYESSVDDDDGGSNGGSSSAFSLDNAMRHVVMGVELLPSNNFHLRLGYNYQRRQELKIANRAALSGISFGLGFKIGRYHLSYALGRYHLAGTSNHITISTNLSQRRSRG
ncbi:MAG: type IX secretion system protein PorQ [Salibacteraceae bacterium]